MQREQILALKQPLLKAYSDGRWDVLRGLNQAPPTDIQNLRGRR